MPASEPIMSFDHYKQICSALQVTDYSSRLIHYTSLNTLENILRSRELWFGKIEDQNDTSEADHFLDAVLAQISRLMAAAEPAAVANVVSMTRFLVRNGTYLSSWCEYFHAAPEGKLGMWREYADGGEGVGIVIDSTQFLPSSINARNLGFHILSSRVDYVHREKAVDLANDMFMRLSNVDFLRASASDVQHVVTYLLAKSPCVKHHSFQDEAEIRFMCFRKMYEMAGVKVPFGSDRRAIVRGRERDFFALELRQYPEHGFDLRPEKLLKRVVVGPKGDRSSRQTAVGGLLDGFGLTDVEIVVSDIPIGG